MGASLPFFDVFKSRAWKGQVFTGRLLERSHGEGGNKLTRRREVVLTRRDRGIQEGGAPEEGKIILLAPSSFLLLLF